MFKRNWRFWTATNPFRWISWAGFWVGYGVMWVAIFVVGVAIIFLPLWVGGIGSVYVTPWWKSLLVFVAIAVVTAPLAFGLFSGYTTAMIGWADEELMNEGREDHSRFWSGIPDCHCDGQTVIGRQWGEHYTRHLDRIGEIDPVTITFRGVQGGSEEYDAYEKYQCPKTGIELYMTTEIESGDRILVPIPLVRGHASIEPRQPEL